MEPLADPYRSLAAAPRADSLTVANLILTEMRQGRVRVPDFQRGLRWRAADNIRLFDSVLRGYPIGALLLWQRPSDGRDLSRIGAVEIPQQARGDAWLVVDGQQRLTALAGALLDLPGQAAAYRVHLDFQEWALRTPDIDSFRAEHSIPLCTLVSTSAFRAWARSAPVDDAVLSRLDELGARIRDYAVPCYFVTSDDELHLREIFARMNSTGARMTAWEVFQAMHGGRDSGAGRIDLDSLRRICEVRGFGSPDNAEILKVVLGASGLDPVRRPEAFSEVELQQLIAQDLIEASLDRTLTFLTEDAHVPHLRLLPYPVVLAILARFFHVHPNPHRVNRAALVRWLWRGAATGAHQRASVSRLREAIRDLQPDPHAQPDEHEALRRLLGKLPRAPQEGDEWGLDRFHHKNARSRIELLTLLSRQPQHLPELLGEDREVEGGAVRLESVWESRRLAVEIIAAADQDSLGEDGRRLASTAANRILLHDRHTGLASLLVKLKPEAHSRLLASHLISSEALEALKLGRIDEFLQLRAKDLSAAVSSWMKVRCDWSIPYLAPLDSYAAGVGTDGA